jgi:hypothetical protein
MPFVVEEVIIPSFVTDYTTLPVPREVPSI